MKFQRPALFLGLLVISTFLVGTAAAGEFTREFSFDGQELQVSNMIGRIEVVGGSSDAFHVLVTVRGRDAAEDLLEFVSPADGHGLLAIEFPLKDHTRYTYPPLGHDSTAKITFGEEDHHEKSWLKRIFSRGGRQITIKGHDGGLELWADVTVEVPAGRSLEIKHGVGEITATGLEADLNLDSHAGPILVENLKGDLLADTGSGQVEARDIEGHVDIDTGSGSVRVTGCRGSEVLVDTGSGPVEVTDVDCRYVMVDTGSGSVEAKAIRADRAGIDTGSGSVLLQLDRMGGGEFVIDTGSGDIELVLPGDASARVSVDTGSGSIRNQVVGADVKRVEPDELEMIIGTGAAQVTLDAGSGSITVRQQ